MMASPPGVEIRRYTSIPHFQLDAATMAAAGWVVVAQSETTGGANRTWVTVAVVTLVLGLLVFPPLWLITIVAAILAVLARQRELVVTYRPQVAAQAPQAPVTQPPMTWGPESQAAPGSRCGNCGKPLSPIWRGRCEHCKASYADAPPVAAGA